MNISCEKCKTLFQISDKLLTAKGTTVLCPRCQHPHLARRIVIPYGDLKQKKDGKDITRPAREKNSEDQVEDSLQEIILGNPCEDPLSDQSVQKNVNIAQEKPHPGKESTILKEIRKAAGSIDETPQPYIDPLVDSLEHDINRKSKKERKKKPGRKDPRIQLESESSYDNEDKERTIFELMADDVRNFLTNLKPAAISSAYVKDNRRNQSKSSPIPRLIMGTTIVILLIILALAFLSKFPLI